ncbi:hypothetical protein KC19_7G111400 [Ceratodon purpureus]|uniref:Uncharacterized protein n=1 Tax=Ceratodon purpureus TaxID=3225 RepID=A0A8T0H589_CERPU|nr:hypothetical protein KC19_7G111400 [Ceratodon purpureus]
MEEYLQKLVIILPATAIAMGGFVLVVLIYSRSRSKGSESNLPVPQRSVSTQVDESLQINREIRNKLIQEAMESVKAILSEEFRKKQATKISQEEFNNLYRKQRGLDSGDPMDAKQMESAYRIPGVASLVCAPIQTHDSASLRKTDSFATLWVEELQKSGDGDSIPNTERESESPEKELALEELPMPPPPPQHSEVIPYVDFSGTELEPASTDCITTQLGIIEATDTNEVKSPNELKLMHDLELYLLNSSSNLYRSMMALSMAQNSGEETTLNRNADLPMMPDFDYQEHSARIYGSVASSSTSRDVPQMLKGGAPTAVGDFEWRLDIEAKDVESPPTTPVRRRPPSHLCRGVQFKYEDHPPALSIIELDPELGYGWRGPDWKEKYGKHHIYSERKGPSIYRKPKLHLASDPGVSAYYKSEGLKAKRKWDTIKNRYREERIRAILRAELQLDIHASAEWRRHLRMTYSDSSSLSGSDQPVRSRGVAGEQDATNQADDPNRIKSMLTSSSSSLESYESLERVRMQLNNNPECKMEHYHCKVFPSSDQGSSRSSIGSPVG